MKQTLMIVSIAITLLFAVSSFSGSLPDWSPIDGAEHNMVAYGHIYIDGLDFASGKYLLFSFGPMGEADCRSKSEIKPDGFYYTTILGGTEGEPLSLKVCNSETGEVYPLEDAILFEADETKANLDIR
jgi:hypothetical protein